MKDCLKVSSIIKKRNRIEYHYEATGKWKQLLNFDDKFFIEYNKNIEEVPDALAIIPLLCNILPVSWFFNLEICVDTIDKVFYKSIVNIKKGYMKMYPKLELQGKLTTKTIQNIYYSAKNVGTLFSGGVDALNTLIKHIDEKPALLTVWGADVKIDDKLGWNKVNSHSMLVAKKYGLEYCYVKSNLKTFLNDSQLCLGLSQHKIDGNWWHEFQHGIGILGLFAPIAYINKYKNIYIASSFPTKDLGKYTCASDPTIDNYLWFSNCKVIHDGCEFSRQQKIKNICDFFDSRKENPIPVRVCWISDGGDNCCECEKCYRTILGLIVEKKNPKNYGFNLTEEKRQKMMKKLSKLDEVKYDYHHYYSEIQTTFVKNYTLEEIPKDLLWFRSFKFKNKKPKYKMIIKKLKNSLKKMIKKY